MRNLKTHAYWLLGIAVTCSTALSIKWTTLATPGMIAVESFGALFYLTKPGANRRIQLWIGGCRVVHFHQTTVVVFDVCVLQ